MVYLQRALRLLPIALGVAALAIAILSQASVFHVQDDAYMYARYAANLRHGDGLAWNPGGEPTWGATALLYVPWVAAISTFLGDDPGRIIVFASAIGMVLALVLMALLVIRGIPSGEGDRVFVLMVCVAIAAVAHRKIAAHAVNGMDTGFSMACLCLLILAWCRWIGSQVNSSGVVQASPQRESGARMPARVRMISPDSLLVILAAWIAFAARPDLGLYSLGIPLCLFVLAPGGNRRESAKVFAGALVLVAATIAWAWWYFGVPVPLSFYIKSLATSFGEPFLARHTPEAREQFIRFLIDYSPLWAFAVLDLPSRWKARHEGTNALWLAVFAATFLHWMYYRFAVLQVVSSYQRFYYPTLPALFFLGATSLSRVVAIGRAWAGKSKLAGALTLLCILACAALSARAIRSSKFMWRSASANHQLARFDLDGRYGTPRAREMWRALDGFTKLGDELVLATTEVGLLSALNPRKQVIDLVGLNENGFARHGFDAHRLCAELRPDVLYLPHPDYTTMIAQIAADPTFQSDYDYCFPSLETDGGNVRLGLALRRSSPSFERLKEIVAQRDARDGVLARPGSELRQKQ